MKIDLKNKTALICASSYGIGFSCANILATTNANIILTSRVKSNLKKAETAIKKNIKNLNQKNKVFCYEVDFSNKSLTKNFISKIKKIHNIDILILNTGGPVPGNFSSFKNIDDFEKETSAITFSASLLIQQLLPNMKINGFGRIINISSIGLVKPITNLAVSNASRSYLAGLMVGIGNEVAPYGITINTILPGIIWTKRQEQLVKLEAKKNNINIKEMIKIKLSNVPANKIGEPNDIGHLATFLSSQYASYINGQFIAVDGGKLGIKR
ncbi:SDR family oxidoreductase [Candidatus Pelagibacter sp.]|nr:SDR family oxidoreductase [Candidatus Pelagibacter sp.]